MKFLLLLSILIGMVSCEVNDGRGECFKEHYILSVKVNYPDQTNVVLDQFNVVNVQTNEDLTLNNGIPDILDKIMGIYPIVDDSQKEKFIRQSSVKVLFTGYIRGEKVCSREFVVEADDCHVYLLKGDTEMIIERNNKLS